ALAGEPAGEWHVRDQPVDEVKDPAPDPRVETGAVHDDPAKQGPHEPDRVDGLDLGGWVLLGDPLRQHPGGEVVALADRGAEDQNSHPRPTWAGGCCAASAAPGTRSR